MKQKKIDIPIAQLKQILDAELAIQNNQSLGGTSPAEVRRMIDDFQGRLNEIASHVDACQMQIEDAHQETLRIVEDILERPIKIML